MDDVIYKPVRAVKDDSDHWYLVPNEEVELFYKEVSDEEMVDSGDFDNLWSIYRVGGDLNLVQLYVTT